MVIGIGAAMLGSAAIGAGGNIAGSLLQKKAEIKKVSTLSKNQKTLNRNLFDFLAGIQRDERGRVISQNSLLDKVKDMPTRKLAGFSDRQKGVLNKADTLAQKLGNIQRPGAGANVHFAALGAVAKPGDTVVVGEDGPEKLHVGNDGTVIVEPNPKSVQNPQQAKARSAAYAATMGADMGMASGGLVDPLGKVDDHYKFGDSWYKSSDMNSYTTGSRPDDTVLSEYNKYLADSYYTYNSMDKDAQKASGQNWNWYEKFNNKGGPDSLFWKDNGNNGYWAVPGSRNLATEYFDQYGDWLKSQETYTSNPYVTDSIGSFDSDKASAFETWYNDSDLNKWYDPNQSLVWRGSSLDFENPFNVNTANTDAALEAFDKYYGDQQSSKTANDNLRSSIMDRLGEDNYSGFNDYLNSYNSGVLKNKGVSWNPETGSWKLAAGDDILAGMDTAANDYMADLTAKNDFLENLDNSSITADDLTRDSGGGWIVDPSKYSQNDDGIWSKVEQTEDTSVGSENYLNTIADALNGYSQQFNSDAANEAFDAAIYDPAVEQFNDETVSAINQQFGDNDLFGSQINKTTSVARSDLEDDLASQRASYVSNMQQLHENRAYNATQSMMSLAQLPEQLRAQQASTEYTKALTDSVFANSKWTDALNEAQLTNEELNGGGGGGGGGGSGDTLAVIWS